MTAVPHVAGTTSVSSVWQAQSKTARAAITADGYDNDSPYDGDVICN
jgi:hypothetical protein